MLAKYVHRETNNNKHEKQIGTCLVWLMKSINY